MISNANPFSSRESEDRTVFGEKSLFAEIHHKSKTGKLGGVFNGQAQEIG